MQNIDDIFTIFGLYSCLAAMQVYFKKQDLTFKIEISIYWIYKKTKVLTSFFVTAKVGLSMVIFFMMEID